MTMPFSGQELASAIIAAALSYPSANGRLCLPDGAVPCDPAALEREFTVASQGLSHWLAQNDQEIAGAARASRLKIAAGVIRAALATLEHAGRRCGDLRDRGERTLSVDFGAVCDRVQERPGLLAQTVAAAAAGHIVQAVAA
ncbi:hypothetical protein GAY29_00530 [Azospirillum brasilense]|uniref:hypothetical protein n=1 Tax=Azospirillum brasilense TaxID=192 RepID=UPI00190C7D3D|nr:hypothetical protein [Azospirillum brasilense]MBK3731604.1 hypothetical protein [Azospirillum brasilense]